jgi:hypothetical protein
MRQPYLMMLLKKSFVKKQLLGYWQRKNVQMIISSPRPDGNKKNLLPFHSNVHDIHIGISILQVSGRLRPVQFYHNDIIKLHNLSRSIS